MEAGEFLKKRGDDFCSARFMIGSIICRRAQHVKNNFIRDSTTVIANNSGCLYIYIYVFEYFSVRYKRDNERVRTIFIPDSNNRDSNNSGCSAYTYPFMNIFARNVKEMKISYMEDFTLVKKVAVIQDIVKL